MAAGQDVPTSVAPTSQGAAVSQTAPAARAILERSVEVTRTAVSQLRPWSEFVDRSAFAKPDSLADATSKIRKNWSYFWGNYAVISIGTVGVSLILHPSSLIVLVVLLALWVVFYTFFTGPLSICGRTFSEKEVVAGGLVASLIILLTTDAIGYIVSALLVAALIVAVHGAFRVPDDLFLDDQPSSGAFLSFLGGNVVQQGAPVVPANRV
eukprot:TRINITY_DN1627_c0_g1_i1.p1 TRINITY_DN1627_c0_g1~~TRINITY_DN1627_c0_g1_i1.p1  ORF type:complete len:210 (-),score=19.92 TRINITY_DN1627_c0_g1_i1:449-1078(-)